MFSCTVGYINDYNLTLLSWVRAIPVLCGLHVVGDVVSFGQVVGFGDVVGFGCCVLGCGCSCGWFMWFMLEIWLRLWMWFNLGDVQYSEDCMWLGFLYYEYKTSQFNMKCSEHRNVHCLTLQWLIISLMTS